MKRLTSKALGISEVSLLVIFGLIAVLLLSIPSGTWRETTGVNSEGVAEEVLVIDAGHGGVDGGAVSADGVLESTVNLEIALRLQALACVFGKDTVMTREDENSVHSPEAVSIHEKKVSDLKNRVSMINATRGAFLISIHQNSFPQTKYSGAQVFYTGSDASLFLAKTAQENLRIALDTGNSRQVSKVPTSIYLFQKITCDGILVECGFMSNPQEAKNLSNADYQKKIACAVLGAYLTKDEAAE